MTLETIREVVDRCSFLTYRFHVLEDRRGVWYLQGEYEDPDAHTGELALQTTRRWFLSPEMTRSEVVQTVFKCALTSMEHRTREFFLYRGKAIFGPHFDVDLLMDLCGKVDRRD